MASDAVVQGLAVYRDATDHPSLAVVAIQVTLISVVTGQVTRVMEATQLMITRSTMVSSTPCNKPMTTAPSSKPIQSNSTPLSLTLLTNSSSKTSNMTRKGQILATKKQVTSKSTRPTTRPSLRSSPTEPQVVAAESATEEPPVPTTPTSASPKEHQAGSTLARGTSRE